MEPNIALRIAQEGANYLHNQIKVTGKFVYQRNKKGKVIKGKYNMLRHAGTIWALKQMDIPIPNINAAEVYLGIGSVSTKKYTLLWDKSSAKLGLNALGILALGIHKEGVDKLEKGMNFFMDAGYHKFLFDSDEFSNFKSEYYPGEAALAYATLGNLEPCLRILKNLHKNKGKDNNIIHDHWALQAVERYLKVSQRSIREKDIAWLSDYTHETAQAIMSQPEKYSGRMCAMATRVEALLAAYKVTQSITYMYGAERILNQLTYYRNGIKGHKCYGAFQQSGIYQIDYTQHAICGFKKFADIKLKSK